MCEENEFLKFRLWMTFLQRWKVMILKSFLHIHKHYDLWFCLSKSFSIYIFFDFTLCGKTFYREYKVFTHKAYRNSRKIFRCKFSTFIWTRKWSIINYEKGSCKLRIRVEDFIKEKSTMLMFLNVYYLESRKNRIWKCNICICNTSK